MKTLILIVTILALVSCANQKLVENTFNGQIIGVVHLSKTACNLYISVIEDATTKTMYPVNLSKEYQVEGIKIQFDYINSRAMQPVGCKVDQVISITEISLVQ